MKSFGLAIVFVAAVAIGCNDAAGPASSSDLEGTWNADSYVFTNTVNTSESVDVTEMGMALSITFDGNTYSGVITLPGESPEAFAGTYTIDGDQLTIADAGEPEAESLTYSLSGNTLTLSGADSYDFDDDGVEEDATTVVRLIRQ